ncbi:MAG: ABC transporter permease [Fervidobacterium sp.]
MLRNIFKNSELNIFFSLLKFEFKRLLARSSTYIVLLFIPIVFSLISSLLYTSVNTTKLVIGVYSKDKSPLSKFTVGVVVSLFRGGTIKYVGNNFEELLKNGDLNAVVIIPEDFTSSLFGAKKTTIRYIPSPVNTELAAAAYIVFKQLFEDLGGGPFFNPKVLREMYTASSVPAPELITDKSMDFSQTIAPSIIFIVPMFIGIVLGAGIISKDKEIGLFKEILLSKMNITVYYLLKYILLLILSFFSSLVAFIVFSLTGLKVHFGFVLILLLGNAIFYSAVGLLVSSIFYSSTVSNIVGSALSVVFLFTSGILVPLNQLAEKAREFVKLSIIYKSTYIVRTVQFFGDKAVNFKEVNFVLFNSLIFSIPLILISILFLQISLKPELIPGTKGR